MSVNADTHRTVQYGNTIELLLQQKGSKLLPYVMRGSHRGKSASVVDQFGAVEAQAVTSRFQPINRVDASTDRRWVFPSDWDLAQLIDHFDELKRLNDPKSQYVVNAVYGMGRKIDDLIITAFDGDAKTGESGGTTTSFTPGNEIAVTVGAAAATGLNVEKLRAAKKILMANEVDLDNDQLVCVITAEQHDDLLGLVQVTSTDFNEKPVLVDGKVTRFLGINFVHCERLDTDGSGYRKVPLFAKSGMYFGQWEGLKTDITQRKDLKGMPWQAYVYGSFGATRLEEKKVTRILCNEA